MKKLTFVIISLLMGGLINVSAVDFTMLADFDGVAEYSSITHIGDNIASPDLSSSIVADPANASNNVLQWNKAGSWGGWDRIRFEFDRPLDLSVHKTFKFKAYAPTNVPIRFKLTTDGDNGAVETNNATPPLDPQITAANTWQEFEIDFSDKTFSAGDKAYKVIDIYFNGGNGDTDTYYLDDIQGPPLASLEINSVPEDNATGVDVFSSVAFTANNSLKMADGSDLSSNLASVVSFKKGTEDVVFSVAVNSDSTKIIVTPASLLDANTVYVCSVTDNALQYTLDNSAVTGLSTSFTTGDAPAMEVYTDFDGMSSVVKIESLGDPAGALDTVAGGNGNTTQALQWAKGGSWWGYERVRMELANPVDLSGDKIFAFDVYSENDTRVRLIISPDGEEKDDATHKRELDIVGGQWTTVYFDYADSDLSGEAIKYLLLYGDLGGSGATLLFDNVKGPALLSLPIVTSPQDGSTEVSVYTSKVTISSEVAMRHIDDSEITDPSSLVMMKKAGADFSDYTAMISGDKKVITLELNEMLDENTSYTFGIKDDMVELEDNNSSVVNGIMSTFTTEVQAPADSVMLADYETVNLTAFGSWNGSATFAKVENPDKIGINVSDSVGEFTWLKSDQTNIGAELDAAINFLATPYLRIKVWADAPVTVTAKFENSSEWWVNREIHTQVEAGQTGKWSELFFDFSGTEPSNLNKILIYIDAAGDHSTANKKYYFDDVYFSHKAPELVTKYSPESAATGVSTLSTYSIISNLAFGLMDADAELNADTLATMLMLRKTDMNGEIVPSFVAVNDAKNTLSVTPLMPLDAQTTYWFGLKDDVLRYPALKQNAKGLSSTFTTGDATAMVVYEDFDGNTMTEVVDAMGDPAGAINTLASDPDPSSMLNFCAQWDKGITWGGWERMHIELTDPVDFSKGQIFSMRIYSPKETYVRFKLGTEKGNEGGKSIEVDAQVSDTAQWQTLYFGFNADEIPDTTFTHIFIYVDGGVAEANTFYIDDLKGPELDDATSSIRSVNAVEALEMYPNPATDILYLSDLKAGEKVMFFNLSGQLIKEIVSADKALDISSIERGVYLVKAGNHVAKLIKE